MIRSSMKNVRIRIAVLLLVAVGIVTALAFDLRSGSLASPMNTNALIETTSESSAQDYSRYNHKVAEHASLPCALCHKRDDNSSTMKFSGHLPCAGCHVQQFADNKNPICSICHTATGLKRFPPLRNFGVKFSHATHVKQTNCATCHKPSRQGTALSIPNGHATCFQCHKPQTVVGGRNIGSCNVCHHSGRPTRNSDWARAFAVNFKHSEHGPSRKLNCTSCHSASGGRGMTSPAASMHFSPRSTKSCATCHNNTRAFGGTDFSDCKRCHEGGSFKF